MLEGAIRRHLLKEGVPEAMITQEDQEWDGHIYCPLRVWGTDTWGASQRGVFDYKWLQLDTILPYRSAFMLVFYVVEGQRLVHR